VELHELHVLQGHAGAVGGDDAVARVGRGVRRDLEGLAVAAGPEQHRLGPQHLELARLHVHDDHAPADAFLDDQPVHVPLRVDAELAPLLEGLLEQRVQQGVAGAVGGEAGALVGVAAEGALVNLVLLGAREGTAPVLHLVDRAGSVTAQELDRVLVPEEVGALDGVVDVVLDRVPVHVGQRGGDSALGRPGVAAAGVDLGDDGHVEMAGQLHGRPQPRETRAHDDDVV
jgi:hypothetical protein